MMVQLPSQRILAPVEEMAFFRRSKLNWRSRVALPALICLFLVFPVLLPAQGNKIPGSPEVTQVVADTGNAWTWQNPKPQGNDLFGVDAIDPLRIVAVGANGTVIRSEDGGITWTVSPINKTVGASLRSTFFSSASNGWVVGDSGIVLKTTNSGQQWIRVSIGSYSFGLNNITFSNGTTGWICGDQGAIFRTTNGGGSWQNTHRQTPFDLLGQFYTAPNSGWVCGQLGTLLRTTNNGATWDSVWAGSIAHLNSVYFTNTTTGWIADDAGRILNTNTAGLTWKIDTVFSGTALHDIKFFSSASGVAVGTNETVVLSANGGFSWSSYPLDVPIDSTIVLNQVATTSTSYGVIVGSSGRIWKTSDNGNTWKKISSGNIFDVRGIFVLSSTKMWAVGKGGNVMVSVDGGGHWLLQQSGTLNTLNSCQFLDDNRGFAVGDTGTILSTTDGGNTWGPGFSGTQQSLYALYFSDLQNGMVLGDQGTVLRTTDGGVVWNHSTFNDSVNFKSVAHTPSGTLWATADSSQFHWGKILSSADNGETWTTHPIEPTFTLNSITFVSDSFGCAVGNPAKIYVTTDAGTTWEPHVAPVRTNFRSVSFQDSIGWAAGDGGIAIKSIDSGKTWASLTSGTNQDLYAVHFVDSLVGWIAGNGGAVLKTINGGGKTVHGGGGTKPPIPQSIRLLNNYPNPFPDPSNAGTVITFELTVTAPVTLRIDDMLGRKVREVYLGVYPPGVYKDPGPMGAYFWDGKDSRGYPVSSGVYFTTLIVPGIRTSSRVVVLR